MSSRLFEDDNLIGVFEDQLYCVKYSTNESRDAKLNLSTPTFFK